MTGKLLAGFILALGLSGSAPAASTTWAFSGHVTTMGGEPETAVALYSLGVGIGSAFFGQVVFESETPDVDADPRNGSYPGAISLFEITIGGYHAAVSSNGLENGMTVSPDASVSGPFGNAGPYGLVIARRSGFGGIGLLTSPLLEVRLPGSPQSRIFGDELYSLLPPDPVAYDFDELFIAGIDGNILGNVTSVEVVPEPTVLLVLLGPLTLAMSRRTGAQR